MPKPKPRAAEEAQKLLDDLDKLSTPDNQNASSAGSNDAGDVLKFIDEITEKSSAPTAPLERPSSRASLATPQGTMRRTTERVRVGSPAPPSSAGSTKAEAPTASLGRSATPSVAGAAGSEATEPSKSGWGWGNVWSSASAALQQARSAVDEGVKHLPTEQASKWREEVMSRVPFDTEQLEKLGNNLRAKGLTTFNDILNVVAPPISEHEVIQVYTSHDMEGYEGVEALVYKALARVMEQVEGGDLVVNRGHESKPREKTKEKNLNAVEGLETASRLAQANIEELIKSSPKSEQRQPSNVQTPTTYSSIYLRLQPFFTTFSALENQEAKDNTAFTHLQFLLYLSDPEHQLLHSTVSQIVPARWIEHMEKHEWVEDVVVDALRTGLETIGQEYIVARMGWLDLEESTEEEEEEEEEAEVTAK